MKKRIVFIILSFLILLYFIFNFFYFKPNIPVLCNEKTLTDDYVYISDALNFAKFNNLDTTFYFAKSVANGSFPSKSCHSMSFTFITGLILKIFGAKSWAVFIPNYLFFIFILAISYLQLKDLGLSNLKILLTFFLISFFPIIVIEINYFRMEAFLMAAVTLFYYLFFKIIDNSLKQNIFVIYSLFLTILSSFLFITRYSFIVLALYFLIYMLIKLIKQKNFIFIGIIFFSFIVSAILFYFFFNTNLQLYLLDKDYSIRYYLYYSLKNKQTFLEFSKNIFYILKNTFSILKLQILSYFKNFNFYEPFFVFLLIIILNTIMFFSAFKDFNKRKKLIALFIPQYLVLVLSILVYSPIFDHSLRMIFCFFPINLVFISSYIADFNFENNKKFIFYKNLQKVVLVLFIFIFIILYSIKTFPQFRQARLNKDFVQIKAIENVLNKYRTSDNRFVVCSDIVNLPECIVYSDDYLITLNYFNLEHYEFLNLLKLDGIDLFLINLETKIDKEWIKLLSFYFDFNIDKIDENNYALVFLRKSNSNIKLVKDINSKNFSNSLNNYAQCSLKSSNGYILINATGNDPHFEFKDNLNLSNNKKYFIKANIISPEETFFQIYYLYENNIYRENLSFKQQINKGENLVIIPIDNSGKIINVRVDFGAEKGEYLLKYLRLYETN